MQLIYGAASIVLLIVFVIYPVAVFIDHMLFPNSYEHRIREWKMFVAKQALVEYQMIFTINETRKKYGLAPIPYDAVIDQFQGIGGWAGLKLKCEETVRYALRKFGWSK